MYTSMNRSAANAYRQIGVQSVADGASPHMLIQLLFDALETSLNAAKGAMQRGEIEEKGRQIACALLEDLMESGPLKVAPSLSFLGLVVMDELCARHIKAPVLH